MFRAPAATATKARAANPLVEGPVTGGDDCCKVAIGGQPGTGTQFCFLFGTTAPFDEATLSMLYPSREAYIDAIDTATNSAVRKGFLRTAS